MLAAARDRARDDWSKVSVVVATIINSGMRAPKKPVSPQDLMPDSGTGRYSKVPDDWKERLDEVNKRWMARPAKERRIRRG